MADIIPVKPEDITSRLDELAFQLAFVNTAIMAICERQYADLGSEELSGLQCILFNIEGSIRGVNECLHENRPVLLPQPESFQTPRQAAEAYLAQEQ